jgi:anhydro-N-acetylmuramic acid kinase
MVPDPQEDAMGMTAVGMMSGTSLDGVDVALIETDGVSVSVFGASHYRPYTAQERALLRHALADAVGIVRRDDRPGVLDEAERVVTRAHAEALAAFLAQHRLAREDIDVVGFHGQTVLHRPADRLTVQIGDGLALARAVQLPVVYDFRAADVAAGGQGAPLVPVYHRALAAAEAGPVAVVNIGGVANITYVDGERALIACDTGPGNALIDDYMFRTTGQACDQDGRQAAQGEVDERWVEQALTDPFFDRPPPKSLDRNAFAALALQPVSVADGAATLTALTAASIAAVVRHLPKPPQTWIIAGGGARNLTLMRMLRARLAPARVEAADARGWAGDALEAQAFAFLAARSLRGLPLSYPATTGVPVALTGGLVARP